MRNKILFGIWYVDKFGNLCKTNGFVKYVASDYIILNINGDGTDLKIPNENRKRLSLLKQ